MEMKLGFINWETTSILSHLLVFTFHAYFWNKQKYWGLKKIPKATQGKPLSEWEPPGPSDPHLHPAPIHAASQQNLGDDKNHTRVRRSFLSWINRVPCTWSANTWIHQGHQRYLQPSSCWGTSGRAHAGFGSMQRRHGWRWSPVCDMCLSGDIWNTCVGGTLEKGSYSWTF